MTGWLYASRVKNILCIAMAALMLAVPLLACGQDTGQGGDACLAGQRDAEMRTNSTLWFGAGCLLGLTGVLIAYVATPSPPVANLIGKNSDWVAVYTDCYKDKGRSKQTNSALVGCLVGTATWVLIYVIIVAATLEESNTSNGW